MDKSAGGLSVVISTGVLVIRLQFSLSAMAVPELSHRRNCVSNLGLEYCSINLLHEMWGRVHVWSYF